MFKKCPSYRLFFTSLLNSTVAWWIKDTPLSTQRSHTHIHTERRMSIPNKCSQLPLEQETLLQKPVLPWTLKQHLRSMLAGNEENWIRESRQSTGSPRAFQNSVQVLYAGNKKGWEGCILCQVFPPSKALFWPIFYYHDLKTETPRFVIYFQSSSSETTPLATA